MLQDPCASLSSMAGNAFHCQNPMLVDVAGASVATAAAVSDVAQYHCQCCQANIQLHSVLSVCLVC